MKKFLLLTILSIILSSGAFSQCAMCSRIVETNQNGEKKVGAGLNKGILYLMSVPYLLLIGGATAWYINRKKG